MDEVKEEDAEDAGGGGDGKAPPLHAWYLVDAENKKLRLPRTMLFLGRDECDIIVQSRTVDKRHAVITFDLYLSRFKVKDLSTTNGTYVNESRIPEQEYVTLNHMDSIRLGYDSKVYHMEQGEPCGDSPPPPPLPLQPPPQLTEADSNHDVDDDEVPAWVSHQTDKMAECQGCIAEQKIEHTCSLTHGDSKHSNHCHNHHPQFVDVQRRTDRNVSEPRSEAELEAEPEPDLEPEVDEKPRVSRNTWPRKRVRQVAHVASIFDADDDSGAGSPILVETGSNYFVSVDDSVCDGGRLIAEYSLSRAGSVQRILRNSKQPLPPELETVKKGTPLYGQPAWWGEDSEANGERAMESQGSEHRSSRPSSLVVHADDPHHHAYKDSKAVYMEIPHQSATTPERDKPPPGGRDKTTPARSVTSSLSKDSLVLSPDSARERSVDKDSSGGDAGRGGPAAAEASSNPALSFTVDFGDEKKPKLKTGASLSEFVPTKIRNSLSLHARPEKSSSSKGKESAGSCKNSEERELSPTRQKRLDELWGYEAVSKGKSTRRSSGQATGVPSLRTSDFASEATPVAEKSKDSRKEAEKRIREVEKDMEKKPPKSPKSRDTRKSSPRASTSKISRSKSQPAATALPATQYSDPTAYLIDKMFAGATGTSMDSPRSDSSEREGSDSPAAPEHVMYKEAREYDRASQRGSLTYRAQDRHSTPKQKKTRKSQGGSNVSPADRSSESPTGVSPLSPSSKPRVVSPEKLSPRSPEKGPETHSGALCSQPQTMLPVAPSPLGDQEEDKVSEAGTYTIEAEEDGAEELMARQQIDEVFGVDVDNFSFERPVIGSLEQVAAPAEEEEGERTLHEDDEDAECRTPCDEDANEVFDDDEETAMDKGGGEEDVPSWISQLNALTAASRRSPTTTTTAATKGATGKEEAPGTRSLDDSSKKQSEGGLNRKRPGTGRKLPSIPTANDMSPVSSEHSARFVDKSPDSPANMLNCSLPAKLENGHDRSGSDSPSRNVRFSPIVSSTFGTSSKSRIAGSPCDSEDSGQNGNGASVPKGSSVCSRGSIDTELLLRDTETVMAAMEARMGFHKDDRAEDEAGSDTDLSSTVAMVNGDEDYVKPSKYHSPRQSMNRKSSKDKDNSNIRIACTSSTSKKTLVRSFSEQKPPIKGSARSTAGVSVVSDVLSRNDSLDQSFQSDVSDGCSDHTDNSFSRSGSRGKGTITMTKPNRAFALRRARADGSETTETARSRTSAASSTTSVSSRRSSSIHGTSRTPYSDRTGTGRTETSLGTQIVRKARENVGQSKPRENSTTRGDGARRNSLRGSERRTSATSSSSAVTSATISSAKKERDIRSLRSQLKNSPGQKDLAITGVSSRSQSQPGSRSNSPKAAERAAWKRRKEYDPRKAVAEAKASKAKEPRLKPKVQASSLYKQRMTRSASFTNSVELSGRVRHDTYNVDSTSSVEDLSSAATASDSYGEASFRRAFIPFHNPLRGDRLSHSADEDEAGTFPTSRDSSSGGSSKMPSHPVSLMLHKSAFTPPLSKLQTPSPDSPPTPASLLLRRRTLGAADYDESGASTASNSHRTQADSHSSLVTSPQSYDSLIVSSIYQLSLKLKTTTDKTLNKLREQDRISITPSPIDDFLGHPAKSEIPAWKSANQELAGVLKNLRKMEHHLHLMERALFPDEDTDTDVSGMSTTEKHKYFQEIERIRSELAGFHPIDTPRNESQDPGSPEMAELSKNI